MTDTRARDTTARAAVRYEPGPAQLHPERAARRDRLTRTGLAVAVPVLIFVLWEISARAAWIDVRLFASPSAVAEQAVELVGDGTLPAETLITVRRLIAGYLLGAVAGIVLGLALSQFTLLRAALEPLLRALYVVPKLAILPLLLLVLGLGEAPKVLFVAFGTFFIVVLSTLSAASMVPSGYHEVATSYGLSRAQRFRWLVLPASLPQIVAALRLASGIAVLLVVAVEFVQSDDGLGHLTWHAWELFMADRMYLGIVSVSVLGVLFSAVIAVLGSRLIRWADEEYTTIS